MRKSRIVCLLLAFCLLFAFAIGGCGSDQVNSPTGSASQSPSTSESASPSQSDSPAQSAAATEAPMPKKGLQLTFWTWKVAYVPGFEAAAAGFEKKTGIKVNIEAYAGDDTYKAKVAAAANAGQSADIVHYWAAIHEIENGFVELSNSGLIDQEWRSRFVPQAFNLTTVKQSQYDEWQAKADVAQVKKDMKVGDCYGLPLEVGGYFTFYGNKKIIEQAGLKAEAPKTWEDFVAMMKVIKDKTGTAGLVLGEGVQDLWFNWCGTALEIMLNGEEGYQALMQRNENMNTPKHLPVIKALETISTQGLLLPGCNAMRIDEADQAFAADQAAFVLGGSFTLANLVAMGKNPDDYIMFPVPPLQGSKYMEWKLTPATMTDLMVSRSTKDQEAALDFLKYITSEEGALLFANNAFCVPAINLGDAADQLIPPLKQINSSFVTDGSSPLDKIPEYPQKYWDNGEWRVYDGRIQRMISGRYTAEQVAQDFDTRMAELKAPN